MPPPSVVSPGVLDFVVETHQDGERVRRATAVLHAADVEEQPAAHDLAALLAAHPRRIDGAEMRKWFDERGHSVRSRVRGPRRRVHTARRPSAPCWPRWRCLGSIRSQQDAYGVHPALLDACFQSVAAHPDVQARPAVCLLLPLGVRRLRAYGGSRNARYCYTRVTSAGTAGSRPTSTCSTSTDGAAGRRGLRLGHRRIRGQRPRARAERAAADHRVAAANAARGHRRRHLGRGF